ncbi:MAG: protein kinase [Gemmatimonadota bacterium]|nr:protein kinase [Gemmatimonadota bacterium]
MTDQASRAIWRNGAASNTFNGMNLRDELQAALGTTYTLERELGGGGMSRVFLAVENALGRKVVIKVLAPELAAGVSGERFAREIRLAANLQHPNIVPLHAAGDAGGLPYYTMPFVEGLSLRSRMTDGTALPVPECVRILRDVARALWYAHDQGVVHRDIKPENVLLSGDAAVVTDFGIAKAVSAAQTLGSGETLTRAGMGIGTPAYMAPEQAFGDPATDWRADIYSFGCLAYELLAGKPPFAGKLSHQLAIAHAMETPPPLETANRTVPRPLSSLVAQCLAKNPDERPQSAREIVERLESVSTSSREHTSPRRALARNWVLIGVAIAVVALTIASVALRRRDGASAPSGTGRVESLAVLPFENAGGDTANAYFAEGMVDELTNALAKIPTIRVAARSSAFTFQGKRVDAREVGRALNVGSVLEGTVRRAGNRLRVSAQLTSASDGLVRWSDSYEREMRDVFSVQDDITRAIVGALRVKLDSGSARAAAARHGTSDLEAYDLYLRGRYAWNKRSPDGLRESIRYFEEAIRRDPTYADAHSGLADAYISLFDYEILKAEEANPRARPAATRALELDPTLAEAHTSLAHVLLHEWKWDEAEAEFKRALELDPEQAATYHWYALALTSVGKLDQAVTMMQRAEQLDPLSARMSADMGMAYYGARQYDRAIRQEQKTLRLEPGFATSYWIMGMAYEQKGSLAEATAAYQSALKLRPGNPNFLASLARSQALAGKTDEARGVLRGLLDSKEPVSPFFIALVYTAMGEKDDAFLWLDKAVAERSGSVRYLKIEPRLDPLRSDPRFDALLQRVGLKSP